MAKKHYLKNEDLINELQRCREKGCSTNALGEMFSIMVEKIQTKLFYKSDDVKYDCKHQAILVMLQNWHKFDETKYNNAFAYFTRVAMNGLSYAWNKNESRPIHIPLSAFINDDVDDD